MAFVSNGVWNRNFWRNWLPAIAICFPYICAVVSLNGISIVLAFLLVIMAVVMLGLGKYRVYREFLITFLFVLCAFALSLVRVKEKSATLDYAIRFLLYDTAPFLIGTQAKDKEKVLKNVLILGCVGLPILFIRRVSLEDNSMLMGLAYSCLPVMVAALIGILLNKNLRLLSLIVLGGILVKLVSFAPRGIWVILISAGILAILQHVFLEKNKGLGRLKAILLLLVIAGILLYVVLHFEAVVKWLDDTIYRVFHFRVYALWKIQYYLKQGNLYNGRDVLTDAAIRIAQKNPLFGRGIGYFEAQNEGAYCHNLLLQTICEGGFFFLVPVIWYVISVIGKVFRYPLRGKGTDGWWMILTFCCGIEMFFFSSVYWIYAPFWLFLGAAMRMNKTNG